MRRLTLLTLMLSLALLSVSTAFAQTGSSGAYLGPHLGIFKTQDSDETSYLGGATLRLRLLPVLAAEGMISYKQEDFEGGGITLRTWPVTATGLLYPLPIIYGGVGAGWYNITFDYSDELNDTGLEDETNQEFGWHLVVGVELPLSEKLHVSGDVRYVFMDYEFKDLPDAVKDGTDADFYSINIALLLGL